MIRGQLIATTEKANVIAKQERFETRTVPCQLLHIDTTGNGVPDTHVVLKGLGKAEVTTLADGRVEVRPKASSFLRAVVSAGQGQWMFNPDSIIPIYVTSALPRRFSVLFLLTLLAAAKASMVTGVLVNRLWVVFIKDAEAQALGICKALVGVQSLLFNVPNWPVVDPLIVALPLSAAVLVAVSLFTRKPSDKLLASVFTGTS